VPFDTILGDAGVGGALATALAAFAAGEAGGVEELAFGDGLGDFGVPGLGVAGLGDAEGEEADEMELVP